VRNFRPHKKLDVWKFSVDFVVHIYDITNHFPREEEFGLKSQLRRASVSVPSNIAEGLTRISIPDKLHFLNMANGSLSEVDTQLEIPNRLNYIDDSEKVDLENQLITIQKLLSGLIRSLKK
jgi:four helix bundle protein